MFRLKASPTNDASILGNSKTRILPLPGAVGMFCGFRDAGTRSAQASSYDGSTTQSDKSSSTSETGWLPSNSFESLVTDTGDRRIAAIANGAFGVLASGGVFVQVACWWLWALTMTVRGV